MNELFLVNVINSNSFLNNLFGVFKVAGQVVRDCLDRAKEGWSYSKE